jgi:hypothetical protein
MKKSELIRKCPNCSKEHLYANKSNYNNAVKKNYVCKSCGLKKSLKNKKSNLAILMEETPLTYYWMGFLLADGNFNKHNRLKVTLSSVDKNHLKNLQEFLKIESLKEERNGKYLTLTAMDCTVVPQICKKFNISHNKTYYPPDLSFIKNKDLKLSLIAGFIDGDGSIASKGKSFSLTVKCHSSWLNNLDNFAKEINGETSNGKINKQGYAFFTICNIESLKTLKRKVVELSLPVLNRKWDKINLEYISNNVVVNKHRFDKLKKLILYLKDIPDYNKQIKQLVQTI